MSATQLHSAFAAPLARRSAALAPARIGRLQMLRALAAAMVVVFHVMTNYLPADAALLRHGLYNLLSGGVKIFFVISGFIIRTTSWNSHGPSGALIFLKKRFVRLAPYYWLITGFIVGLSLTAPDAFGHYQFEWRNAAASAFFIPWPRIDGTIFPPLAPGWSLNFEVMFYLVFAGLMLAARRERALVWLAAIFIGSIGVVTLCGANRALFIIGNAYALEFVAGAVFADVWRARQGRFPIIVGWTSLFAGVGLLALFMINIERAAVWPALDYAKNAGFACLFVAFMTLPALAAPVAAEKALALTGEASYSIYLVHPIVLSPLAMIFRRLVSPDDWPGLFVALVSLAAIGAGLLAWRAIEAPLLASCQARLGLRRDICAR